MKYVTAKTYETSLISEDTQKSTAEDHNVMEVRQTGRETRTRQDKI